MNDYRTRFGVKMLAMSLTAIVTGLLVTAVSSERAALIAALVTCVAVLAGWEYWHWNARRGR